MKPKPIRRFNKNRALKIKITNEFKVRIWIAAKLFKLGAFILGVSSDIEFIKSQGKNQDELATPLLDELENQDSSKIEPTEK